MSFLQFCRPFSFVISNLRRNHYKLLGIVRTDNQKEIKKAYLNQAKLLHPDYNPGDPSAQQKFQTLQDAYNILKDKEAKKQYDMTILHREDRQKYGNNDPSAGWFCGKTQSQRGTRYSYDDPNFDPWVHSMRSNQAQKFWEAAMKSEFADPYYDFYQHDDPYFSNSEHDDDIYFEEESKWNSFYDPINYNHQRYNMHRQADWERQQFEFESRREKYESRERTQKPNYRNIFNQKHGFSQSSYTEYHYPEDYTEDVMDDLDSWTRQAFQESHGKKKGKRKKKKRMNDKRSNVDEFYSNLKNCGKVIIEIDGEKFMVQEIKGV